jgi:hypothetical protein
MQNLNGCSHSSVDEDALFWDVTLCQMINGYKQWMKALQSLETLVIMYQSTWHNITEDSNCQMYRTLYYVSTFLLTSHNCRTVSHLSLHNLCIYIRMMIFLHSYHTTALYHKDIGGVKVKYHACLSSLLGESTWWLMPQFLLS